MPIKTTIERLLHQKAYQRKIRSLGGQQRIVLSSTPRGGSTWLQQVLMAEQSVGVWEPLHPKWLTTIVGQDNGHHDLFAKPDQDLPALEEYLKSVLFRGKTTEEMRLPRAPLRKVKEAKYVVFKFCRLLPLLPWYLKRFDTKVVHLARSPFAVVSSQLRHPAWDYVKQQSSYYPNSDSYCPSFYQNYASLTSKLRHPEEFLTAKWCLDYIPLTQQQQSENLCVIHYEDLVNLGVDHFKAAFTFLGLSFDNSLENLVNRPSFTTQKGSNVLQGKNPLSTYRSHLNNEQIGRIEDTLSSFGLSDWRSSLSHHEILSA